MYGHAVNDVTRWRVSTFNFSCFVSRVATVERVSIPLEAQLKSELERESPLLALCKGAEAHHSADLHSLLKYIMLAWSLPQSLNAPMHSPSLLPLHVFWTIALSPWMSLVDSHTNSATKIFSSPLGPVQMWASAICCQLLQREVLKQWPSNVKRPITNRKKTADKKEKKYTKRNNSDHKKWFKSHIKPQNRQEGVANDSKRKSDKTFIGSHHNSFHGHGINSPELAQRIHFCSYVVGKINVLKPRKIHWPWYTAEHSGIRWNVLLSSVPDPVCYPPHRWTCSSFRMFSQYFILSFSHWEMHVSIIQTSSGEIRLSCETTASSWWTSF